MSPAAEVSLLAVRELRRSLRSAKGIILGAITLAGAFVASYMSVALESGKRARVPSEIAFVELKRKVLEDATGDAKLAAHLAPSPDSLFFFFNAAVWLAPLLIALLGFDAVSGELQHRSLRFWAVRTRRSSYFIGKLLGVWALVAMITLVINGIAAVFAMFRGYVHLGDILSWGTRFYLVAVFIAAVWAVLVTFISSRFRTPILALLSTFGTFFVLWLFWVFGAVARGRMLMDPDTARNVTMTGYDYLYPNSYYAMLLSPEQPKVLTAIAVLGGFIVAVTAGGSYLFARRDI